MLFAIVFTLAAGIASAFAQTTPACYVTCAAEANYGNCSASDASCLCNDASFVSGTTQCIEQTCQGANLTTALALGQQLCLAVGVTLTVSASSTASGTTTPTSSASSSGSAPATSSSAAAVAHNANAFIGLAAVGLVALAL